MRSDTVLGAFLAALVGERGLSVSRKDMDKALDMVAHERTHELRLEDDLASGRVVARLTARAALPDATGVPL